MFAAMFIASALAGGPGGRVLIDNESGTAVTLMIPERAPLTVQADEQAVVFLPYGTSSVRATYTQFGRARTLEVETVTVTPHTTAYVHLEPADTTRVRVTNDTWAPADLYVNDRLLAHLEPGASQIVRAKVGRAELELRDVRGRVLDEECLHLRAYADNAWAAERPRTAPVLVSNPNGIPVTVEIDGRYAFTVDAWDSERMDVAVGDHRIDVFDARGRLVESSHVDVDPWQTAELVVDGPAGPPPGPPYGAAHGHDDDRYDRDDAIASSHCAQRPR